MGRPREDPTLSFDVAAGGVGELCFLPAERWKLRRLIGRGGQADVWLAQDLELEQPVVLKVFHRIGDPVAVERMRREVRLGRELHHPGLVRLFDLVEMNGFLVAVMEWVPGGSLASQVSEGPLAVDRVVEIAGQVLETLAYLHGEGVIHRDIKPSNLLLNDDGRVLLGDLGLARRLVGGGDLTRTLTTVGTPAYMAPEQLRGEELTPAADLYGLGVTLFQLLTGETPFAASSEFEMADSILHRRVRPVRAVRPGCPRWFASFIDRLLERGAADRFPDGRAALEAFRRRRAVGSRRKRRWVAAMVGLAGLAVGAGAVAHRALSGPAPLARVEQVGNDLVAFDASGRELWRRRMPGPVDHVLADVVGSPEPEVVLNHVDPLQTGHRTVALDILGHGGTLTGTVTLQESPRLGPFTTSADWQLNQLGTADVDGDGHRDVVWSISHRVWFPAALGVWEPRSGLGPRDVLINSGSVERFDTADLDGDGADDLVVAVYNNPMGFQKCIAIVAPRRQGSGNSLSLFISPDLRTDTAGSFGGSDPGRFVYVPLGSNLGHCGELRAGEDGITARFGDRSIRLDPSGNPEGSPLYGEGSARRVRFWQDLGVLCRKLRIAPHSQLTVLWRRFRDDHRAVLAEKPSETGAALMAARAMADGGDPRAGAVLLERTARRIPQERDLLLRAGEYRLIAGERAGGWADLRKSLPLVSGGRNPYDQFLLLGLDAVSRGDEGAFAEALHMNNSVAPAGSGSNTVERLQPALLWAEGRWNDPQVMEIRRDVTLPILDVLDLWARLERGGDPGTVAREAARLESNSGVPEMARLLQAVAELRLGHVVRAHRLAETTLAVIDRKGRRSYELACWRPLACLVAAEAAAADGGSPHRVEWLREAASAGNATWYGRRAAKELAALSSGGNAG